jgi:iron(III) transport system substrate-binding protein
MTSSAASRRPIRSRAIVAGALIGLAALVVAGCGSSSSSGTSSGGGETITLYNSQHEQTTDALIKSFTKATGIHVRVKSDGEDVFTAQIEQEGSRSPADVFYSENSNWLQQLADKNLLDAVDANTLANVPTADSAIDGKWVGVSARVSVMIYNTKALKPAELPTSILGLADPKWKGKLELAPAETDFWPVVSSVEKAVGKEKTLTWLRGLRTNAGANASVPSNETVASDVAKGTGDLSLINGYYFYRLISEIGKDAVKADIAYFTPRDPGYVENISAAGILKASKHEAAAQKFLNFLTSAAGQRILAGGASFEYPIHPGVAANPELTPLDRLSPNSFSPAELGTGLNAKELLQEAGLL